MPNYVYENCQGEEVTVNVPIAERDNVDCGPCGKKMKRLIRFEGRVWAPTAGGTR